MVKKLRYGMVGGSMDAFIGEVHRKALAFDTRAEFVGGVFSADAKKNAEVAEVYELDSNRIYSDYMDMAKKESLDENKIDFVVIATPNYMHYEVAKAFLKADINVVCEKPLCFTIKEAEELRELSLERGLLFAVTYTYTGYNMVKVMREMVQSGKIGKILSVNAEYAQEWLLSELTEGSGEETNTSIWRTDSKYTGIANCVGDIGTHIEDTVAYITGFKIEKLLSTVDTYGKALDMNANILVEYDNGVHGSYWCSQIAAGSPNGLAIRIYGDKGSLEWQQHFPDYLRYTPLNEAPRELCRGAGYLKGNATLGSRIPTGHPEGLVTAFANIYRNYIGAVLKQKNAEKLSVEDLDFPNATDGLNGVKFIHAVIESGRDNSKWVKL